MLVSMSSPHEILVALERDYRIAMSKYERAEMAVETIVGVKMLASADQRIQAQKRALKEKMDRLDYLIRSQVDPEWTPHHLTPLHVRRKRPKGSIAKAAYQTLRTASEPMKVRDVSLAIATGLDIDPTDSRAMSRLDATIRDSFQDIVKEGAVEEVAGRPTRWQAQSKPKWAPSNAPVAYASVPVVRGSDLTVATARAVSASSRSSQHQA